MDEFTKIVLSAIRPFIGHHQRLFACVKSVFKESEIFLVFYNNKTTQMQSWIKMSC